MVNPDWKPIDWYTFDGFLEAVDDINKPDVLDPDWGPLPGVYLLARSLDGPPDSPADQPHLHHSVFYIGKSKKINKRVASHEKLKSQYAVLFETEDRDGLWISAFVAYGLFDVRRNTPEDKELKRKEDELLDEYQRLFKIEPALNNKSAVEDIVKIRKVLENRRNRARGQKQAHQQRQPMTQIITAHSCPASAQLRSLPEFSWEQIVTNRGCRSVCCVLHSVPVSN